MLEKEIILRYIIAIFITIISFPISAQVTHFLRYIVNRNFKKTGKRSNVFVEYFAFAFRVCLIIVSISVSLKIAQLNTTVFYSTLGILGLIIPLTVQIPIQDFACGIFIILFDKYRVGDYLVTDFIEGKVKQITAFSTEIDSINGIEEIPNSSMWRTNLKNLHREKKININLEIVISNVNDFQVVERVIKRFFKKQDEVLPNPLISIKRNAHLNHESGGQVVLIQCQVLPKHFVHQNQELPKKLFIELQRKGIVFIDGNKPVSLNYRSSNITPILLDYRNQVIN